MTESLDISRQLILITSTNIPGWRNMKVSLLFLFLTRHLSSEEHLALPMPIMSYVDFALM